MEMKLLESAAQTTCKVDLEKGIIYGVKVLGEDSRNHFVYPKETRIKAHKLLEGLKVNVDHKRKKDEREDVPLESRFGKIVNIREGDGGTFADLRFNVKHKLAESIAYAAEHLPDTLGLSINGGGRGTRKDANGRKIVDEITFLKSCDLVSDPGSTHSLFESNQNMETETGLDPALEGIKTHIMTLLGNAKSKDEALAALKTYVEEEAGEGEGEGDDDEVEESNKQFARLKLEKDVMLLCESMKYTPTHDTIELLADLPDEAKRKTMITKLKAGTKTAPKSGVPLRESEAPADPDAKKKHLLKILRG